MNITEVVKKLIFLPHLANSLGNVSIYDLLKETRYFEVYGQISEKEIRDALARHSKCIDEWLCYSADKRSSSGWYITQENKDSYVVGYFDEKEGKRTKMIYVDQLDACAAFIKREVEEIRLHNNDKKAGK